LREILYGVNSVLEALRANRKIKSIYTARGKMDERLRQVVQTAETRGVKLHWVDRALLERMAESKSHQGVVAEAESYRYYAVGDILACARDEALAPLLLVLDGIEDPQNLGAILRTAECMGVHGAVIPKHEACAVTPAVSRASAGASEHLKVARVTNLVQTIKDLKKQGLWVVGTDSQASASCFDLTYPGPVALVIGGEGRGIRRLVKESCDYMVHIPMRGQVNSLNASVSCAIVLAEIVKQRWAAATSNG